MRVPANLSCLATIPNPHTAICLDSCVCLHDSVFTRSDGRPLSSSMVDKAWRGLNDRAGVPAVRFHDLRHTAATLLLGRGVHPKIVSEMLGHATVAITLDLYSHVTPTMQREAAVMMDELLSQ
jgi:integrase